MPRNGDSLDHVVHSERYLTEQQLVFRDRWTHCPRAKIPASLLKHWMPKGWCEEPFRVVEHSQLGFF